MSEDVGVGFVGLGRMGGAITERLLRANRTVHVYDRSAEAMQRLVILGAIPHTSPRTVADNATVVFACLPSPEISIEVALGQDGIGAGSVVRIYAEMSTIGSAAVKIIADGLRGKGIETIDLPVTGGPEGALVGRLTVLASGSPSAFDAVKPIIQMMGDTVHMLGDSPGTAQTMKVVNNIMFGAHMVVASEALRLGAEAGLDPNLIQRVLRTGSGQSRAACESLVGAVNGIYDRGAALSVLDKDMSLGQLEAKAMNVPMPTIDQAASVWRSAMKAGLAAADHSSIYKFVKERDNTE